MKESASVIGVEITYSCDLRKDLELALSEGYEFALTPLVHPLFERNINELDKQRGLAYEPLTRSDLIFSSSEWRKCVLGEVSDWIRPESPDPEVRKIAKLVLEQEVTLASYLGLGAVVLPGLADKLPVCYSHMIYSLEQRVSLQFWIRIPVVPYESLASSECLLSSWERWNAFRTYCSYQKKIGVALELTEDIPSDLDVWLAEPLFAVMIPTRIFVLKKNNLILPAKYVRFLTKCIEFRPQFIVLGRPLHGLSSSMSMYYQCLSKLFSVVAPDDGMERFCSLYDDYLQTPLEPLTESLESPTYEIFEKDKKKYSLYEEAIFMAIGDQVEILKTKVTRRSEGTLDLRSGDNFCPTSRCGSGKDVTSKIPDLNAKSGLRPLVVIIVGAGRGPIVEAAMRARDRHKHPLVLFALEKNPHAFNTLINKKMRLSEWSDVNTVHVDAREWKFDGKADIIVSEMLGSFGDNELSPECLHSIQHILQPDGVLIPQEYSSYVAPISTSKLWAELNSLSNSRVMEMFYVVRFKRHCLLDLPRKAFTFVHPDHFFDSTRQKTFEFSVKHDSICHGLAGYFDCKLYGNVYFSIVPETHTDGLFSWFPVYFPFKVPLLLSKNDVLVVHLERCRSDKRIWYEWCVVKPIQGVISNINGKSHAISM